MSEYQSPLRMGMVGGGRDAFIGAVHRSAARLDGKIEFVAGALSSMPEKAIASGRDLGLPNDRNYSNWQELIERESQRSADDRVDFISIVTPNNSHFEIAHAAVQAGFHVVIDKPMVTTIDQAQQLVSLVDQSHVVFAVTYNYSGYPMVRHARHLARTGELGDIRKVIVEYNQGWLTDRLESKGQKQAAWRTDPSRAGVGGAIGDIGSHAEQLVSYIAGVSIDSLCADLTSFVPGRPIDDDANVLLRFSNGAKGILTASQICVGNRNDLRIRVWGTKAGLEWRQEEPNRLLVRNSSNRETYLYRGDDSLCEAAKSATRLPPGHPEAFIEAFANIYLGAARAMRGDETSEAGVDYPDIHDGVRGVRFIHAVVNSSQSDRKWLAVEDVSVAAS